MKRTKRARRPGILLLMLLASGTVVALLGLILRHQVGQVIGSYQEKPAVAVPFLLMNSSVDRELWRKSREPAPPETESTEPATEPPTEPPTEPTTQPPETQPPAVYGQDESWFDDALFLGDSRMVSLGLYARLGKADYFADVGMTVFSMFTTQASDENFSTTDLESLLKSRTYGKIYIMLGLNEAGYELGRLLDQYAEDVARLRELAPNADIYLLQVYGVSRSVASASPIFAPDNLKKINDGIAAMADGQQIFCLDPRPLFEDEEGYLRENLSGDGVHPYEKYSDMLPEWLCEQTGRQEK